jgi:hypothetical protein
VCLLVTGTNQAGHSKAQSRSRRLRDWATTSVGMRLTNQHQVARAKDCHRLPKQPRPYRVLMNFMGRDGAWAIHFIEEGCKTPLSRHYTLDDLNSLREMVLRTDPPPRTIEELDSDIRRWGRGSVYLHLTEAQYLELKSDRSKTRL